ncbi:eukaryotic translation initiation factor 4B [Vanessa cardui]|uniref:eukaryotic translation initiation factor 4B n=1 Tax=Vanessa cardui TaxID=171605 RepID=UPI001F12AACF|nr:eukaryotic translation initiation factor 4B [Vanessa cardui]
MAATGKKSKKIKWIKADPTNFIAESTTTTTPAASDWADSVDDGHTYVSSRHRAPVVLPSASRAARGGLAVDDESIPRRPPYIAHISNLPYDVEESAIMEFFEGLKINNLRLPKEGGRLKGFGDVDFEDRESLVSAMNMPDLMIGGRRIRIEVSTQDNDRRMGRSGRSDRDREYDPERTMGDWRSGPRAMPEPARRSDATRDRERERDSSADNRPGGWRDAERSEPARTPYGGRDSYGRDRDSGRDRGYGGRDGFRTAERDGYGSRESRGFGGRGFGDRDRDPVREDSKPRERPKLNLLPRTVPRETETPTKPADGALLEDKIPEKNVPKPVPAEKVFGAAKPVDTAAKEREIEERLRKQEEESRRAVEEKERWGRRNDHSGDRRGGARRDDRGRDSRSYNRDRRDYSRDDKDDRDRRDYSKDGKDRRDYSKDNRDRRDFSKDDRDRRDYSKDDKDRRERDDRDRRDRDDRDRRDRDNRDRDYRDDRDRDYRDDRDRDYRDEKDRDYKDERDRDYRDDRNREGKDDDRRDKDDGESERDNRDRRDISGERNERQRDPSSERKDGESRDHHNGRQSRSRDRHDVVVDKPMPKLKEQEKPNFVASNKFSFLEDADDGGSD